MKLNGWQRLWVAATVVWILPVLAMSYESWPGTADGIADSDICARMKPENARWLVDCYGGEDATAAEWQVHYPALKKDNLLDRLVAEDAAKIAVEDAAKTANAQGPSEEMVDVFTKLAAEDDVKKNGPSADIDGRTEKFLKGVSRQGMDQTASDYNASLRHSLALRRVAFVGEAFAGWMVPAVALYALGWVVGWVRRGFGANRLGRIG